MITILSPTENSFRKEMFDFKIIFVVIACNIFLFVIVPVVAALQQSFFFVLFCFKCLNSSGWCPWMFYVHFASERARSHSHHNALKWFDVCGRRYIPKMRAFRPIFWLLFLSLLFFSWLVSQTTTYYMLFLVESKAFLLCFFSSFSFSCSWILFSFPFFSDVNVINLCE